MSYYTVLLVGLAHVRWYTDGRSAIYPVLLWLVPLGTSFMFFMFLRDVYQHSNADDGRLTNSRVFFTDFFTRWAVFVYGQDMHIPHHLFPAVPHYRLGQLHELLKQEHDAYRSQVVETHGTFHDDRGRTTILDEMTRPRAKRFLERGLKTGDVRSWEAESGDPASARPATSRRLAGEDQAGGQQGCADDAGDDTRVETGQGRQSQAGTEYRDRRGGDGEERDSRLRRRTTRRSR